MKRDKEAMAELKEQQRLVGSTQIDIFERFEDNLLSKDKNKNISELGSSIIGKLGKIDKRDLFSIDSRSKVKRLSRKNAKSTSEA